jgi:Ca-activated chloride channel family protein
MVATERNKLAVSLRDQGKIDEAKEVLKDNVTYLTSNAAKYDSDRLDRYGVANNEDLNNLDAVNWREQRKRMRDWQYYNSAQRRVEPRLRGEQ